MTDEKAEALNKIKYKQLHFAWDNPNDTYTYEKLKEYAEVWKGQRRNKKVYVLTNYNSTHEQDLERIYKLVEIGYDPYVMIYDKLNAPQKTRYLQRWCNNKIIFNKQPDFSKYDRKIG